MADRIELAQAIAELREQLATAMAAGVGKPVQFKVGAVDLEFQVEIGREGGGGGKIRFWIVEAGGDAKLAAKSAQTLKIRLDPIDAATKTQMVVADLGHPPAQRPSPAVG